METRVAEPGQNRRELFRLTGLEVQENQARRLLNDLRSYRAYLEQKAGRPVPESVAGHRWVSEVYLPVVEAIPAHLAGRLAPAQVFHEVLEHRWFLSEAKGADVGRSAAVDSYVKNVLRYLPDAKVEVLDDPPTEEIPIFSDAPGLPDTEEIEIPVPSLRDDV